VRILSRYFLASYVSLFFAILALSLVALAVVEMLANFEHVFTPGSGPGDVLRYLFLRLPAYYLRDLVPLSSFAAALLALGLPARRHEVMAIKAGGVSIQRVALPILAAAALFSVAALFVNETVVLTATREWNRLGGDPERVTFRRGSFWYHRGEAIYNVRDAMPEKRMLRGVSLYELSPRGLLLRSVQAQRVRVTQDHRWEFLNATVRRFDPARSDRGPSVERPQELSLDLGHAIDAALLSATPATLSLPHLREFIAFRNAEGLSTSRHLALFHARLSEPLGVLLFALVAIPFGIGVERSRSLLGAGLRGVLWVAAYLGARLATAVFAPAGATAASAAPWIVLALFGALGAWRFARIPR
jgi:lipopolysaccharide export system permease protein